MAGRPFRFAMRGHVALFAVFAVIVGLTVLEIRSPRVTSITRSVHLAQLRAYRLIGTSRATTFLAGAGTDVLYGVMPARNRLLVQRWNVAAPAPTLVEPSMSVIDTKPGRVSLSYWGAQETPALVVARPVPGGARIDVLAVDQGLRRLAGGRSAAPVRGAAQVTITDWDGRGPDLLLVDRTRAGATHLLVYQGALGNGPRIASIVLPSSISLPPSSWTLVVVPAAARGVRPELVWVTRGVTSTRRTEIHVMRPSGNYQSFAEQIATSLPDRRPGLRWTAGVGAGAAPQLDAIDPGSGLLRIISSPPVAGEGSAPQ